MATMILAIALCFVYGITTLLALNSEEYRKEPLLHKLRERIEHKRFLSNLLFAIVLILFLVLIFAPIDIIAHDFYKMIGRPEDYYLE